MTLISPPVVSVVLPVYNGALYLRAALDSMWAQTFADFELIVVDDGSTDATPAILAECADPRLVVLRTETNTGLPAALNRSIAAARGSYIARMDADDISLPDRLARQVAYLQAHPALDVLGTGYTAITADGQPLFTHQPPPTHGQIAWNLLFFNPVTLIMARRDVLAVGYSVDFPVAQDYELWTRLIDHARFANLPDPLFLYRRLGNEARQDDQRAAIKRALQRWLGRLHGEPPPLAVLDDLFESMEKCLGQRSRRTLTRAQSERVIALLRPTYQALVARQVFTEADQRVVQSDLARRVRRVARCRLPFWYWRVRRLGRAC